jgi:hypothetical protein
MWIRIRAVIIEDEPLAAQYLAALLDDTCQVAQLPHFSDGFLISCGLAGAFSDYFGSIA